MSKKTYKIKYGRIRTKVKAKSEEKAILKFVCDLLSTGDIDVINKKDIKIKEKK